jgi:hypothetical protein
MEVNVKNILQFLTMVQFVEQVTVIMSKLKMMVKRNIPATVLVLMVLLLIQIMLLPAVYIGRTCSDDHQKRFSGDLELILHSSYKTIYMFPDMNS